MGNTDAVPLDDRGVVRIAGGDAEAFLDNLVTQDVTGTAVGEARFAALLSPQGKILFDFFVVRTADGYLIDVTRDKAAELAKRLSLYKLRAKVVIEDMTSTFAVATSGRGAGATHAVVHYRDPRAPELGERSIMVVAPPGDAIVGEIAGDYGARRIRLGIPEGGKDYAFGDTFPHEANMDRLNGVSFTKGCFVGQEVVARMQHKTVVRKRIVHVIADGGGVLASGAEVKAGDATIGRIGSVSGSEGLAMLRLDRAVEAIDQGQPVTVDGQAVRIDDAALKRYTTEAAQKAEQRAERI